jgi:KDO2-lipid IV(A) lauroyltransferase
VVQNALGKIALTPLALIGWVYALAPDWGREALAGGLAVILRLFKIRHGVVDQNLHIAFPGESPAAVEKRAHLKHEADRHLAFLFFEMCLVMGPFSAMPFFVRHRTTFLGIENWKNAHAGGHGTLILSSHIGCWEVMAAAGAMQGMDAVIVTKRIKPAWLHDWIEKGRKRCGVAGAYEPKTLQTVLRALPRGASVGFVLDQYAGSPIGVRVPLFGVPVGTANVVATLAKRTGAPVLPVVNWRDRSGRFVVDLGPALQWKNAAEPGLSEEAIHHRELAVNTAHYVSILEKHILDHPEQWLWIHRRFKGDLSPLRPEEWNQPRLRKG